MLTNQTGAEKPPDTDTVTHDPLENLTLFFGDSNNAEVRVYARLPDPPADRPVSLAGSVQGPACVYARTLTASIPLVDQGPGNALLAQAIVPDPCCWSPDMPYLYTARIQLRSGGKTLASIERTLGVRPLAALGRRFRYAGKTWVLRATQRGDIDSALLAEAHTSGTALVVNEPDDALCQEASRVGVLLAVQVRGNAAQIDEHLRRLARWPAVGMAIVHAEEPLSPSYRQAAPNLLLGASVANDAIEAAPAWADFVVVEIGSDAAALDRSLELQLPLVAQRLAGPATSIAAARAACDQLQRDLAGRGEFAGYIV